MCAHTSHHLAVLGAALELVVHVAPTHGGVVGGVARGYGVPHLQEGEQTHGVESITKEELL